MSVRVNVAGVGGYPAFSIDVPDGFVRCETPDVRVDTELPTEAEPLALFACAGEGAIIAVAARPAYETGSVLQWTSYLCEFFGIDALTLGPGRTCGAHAHAAVLGEGRQTGESGEVFGVALVALEDGGTLVTVHGRCPAERWGIVGDPLQRAVRSISLAAPRGPTRELDSLTAKGWTRVTPAEQDRASAAYLRELAERREPVEQAAAALIAGERFDEAEAAVVGVDSSIYGAVALARLYEARLRALAGQGGAGREDRARVERVFRRALRWAESCVPEAHTAEEAERFASAGVEARARLVAIVGYDPG